MPVQETVILLDIEGTITSISFVKDTLFPYVTNNLVNYINKLWGKEKLEIDLELLREQAAIDSNSELEGFVPIVSGDNAKQSIIDNIRWQMSIDRKTTALKQLQGHIWKEGYENGVLKGHLYEDVLPVLNKLIKLGKRIYTYSSGSTNAQEYLFQYSMYGDVSNVFIKYFDTKMGPKNSVTSYTNIANDIGVNCGDILFLTDILTEAEAAIKAGCNSALLERPGNAPLDPEKSSTFKIMKTLNELLEN
ncbi:HAD-like domain,Enolase-phosphatase E1,Enolase-phosphatase E1, eukaryotes [Cinara cedri]|uniref:Enolase-phosphatase E1 n=1 Tax=Cinara cedri TaxID=506608 RepID=A0A5E4MNQ8_9HEMI|nr:HAD-like domain,Enolase-phosphatase E1,Enolase-phosphatase E1, eukaryotes [Cinara cedri]